MDFKKLSAVEMVETAKETANVLIEEDGIVKKAPKGEAGSKTKKELMYEWNFSVDDEVYELYENVNEDLSWLTKQQDDVDFEIVCENYAKQCDYNNEGVFQSKTFRQDIFGIGSSMYGLDLSRYVNLPIGGEHTICKDSIFGSVWGESALFEYRIDDTTGRTIELNTEFYFNICNGLHYDLDNEAAMNVENGGTIMLSDNYPFKSIRIYKITH